MENITRCGWCLSSDLCKKYHDEEWGVPVYDDQKLFEFLILETFQAGLSWITILKKRENFRLAFDDFDYLNVNIACLVQYVQDFVYLLNLKTMLLLSRCVGKLV